MEKWRKAAIDLLPEERNEILNDSFVFSTYSLFFSVKEFWKEAARDKDKDFGGRIIQLVEWFLDHKDEGDFYNAVCTAFLEHIPDDEIGLSFGGEILPEHIYSLAIECSDYLGRNKEGWRSILEKSVSRYNSRHGIDITIKWHEK